MNMDAKKYSSERGTAKDLMWKYNFEIKYAIVMGSSLQILGAATEKAHLPRLNVDLRRIKNVLC